MTLNPDAAHASAVALHKLALGSSDREWLELNIQGISEPMIRGVRMPGFPEEQVQRGMVGSAGEVALREAFLFWQEAKGFIERFSVRSLGESNVLDFGSGWGRYLRLFLKDTPPAQLAGVDVDPEFVSLAARLLPGVRFSVVQPLPPTSLPSGHFDLIYAYSVFSHLSEPAHQAWITEFERILNPGGLLIVTTQGRHFIEFCARLRQAGTFESDWHRALARSFVDPEQSRRDYDQGRFLYSGTGGGGPRDSSFYGEAIVSPAYVRSTWNNRFEILDFVDDVRRCPQAIIVARKW
jgi:SAM-dependent methyltransferase